jgi:CHAT domain-containing protein/tetratricopeptide (TPR) repeat protein
VYQRVCRLDRPPNVRTPSGATAAGRIFVALAMLCGSVFAFANEQDWDEGMERGIAAFRIAQLEQAEHHFRRAVRAGQYVDADHLLSALVSLSEVRRARGDFAEAEHLIRRGIDIVDRIPGIIRGEKAILLNNLAALYELQGRLSDAESLYLQALSIREKDARGTDEERLTLLGNIASFYANIGETESAAAYFEKAEALLNSVPADSDARAAVLNNRGVFLEQTQRTEQAIALFDQAAHSAGPSARRLSRASSLHNLGTALLRRGRFDEARKHLLVAAEIRRSILGSDHPDLAVTLFSLAEIAEARGTLDEALTLAREASAILRRRVEQSIPAHESTAELRQWRAGFMTHLRLLSSREPAAPSIAIEAFGLAQLAKYTDTTRAVASMAARFASGTGEFATLIRDRQEIAVRRRLLEAERARQIALADRARDSAAERQLQRELEGLQRQFDAADKVIASRYPSLLDLTSAKPRPYAEIAPLITADEVMVLFMFGEREGIRIEATKSGISLYRLPITLQALERSVRMLRASLDIGAMPGATVPVFPAAAAHRLYRELFAGSSAPSIPAWLVVADGPIESLPLSVLLSAEPDAHGDSARQPWLVRKHRIAYLPGVSAFHALRRLAPREFAAGLFAAFADPVLRGSNAARRALVTAPKLRNRRSLADPELLRIQPALPDSADEVRAIAKALGGGDLFLAAEATEQRVRSMDLTKYRYLMFATHGLVAGDHPGIPEPGLVLTPPRISTPEDDGLLTAAEVAQLRLDADWVVLSACNTAAADGAPHAEGFSGLAKAFFHAGSRALLVSHWPVVSESTVLLTTRAFRELRANAATGKSEALRLSMLAILDDPQLRSFHHPLYWAPFVVVGDGR